MSKSRYIVNLRMINLLEPSQNLRIGAHADVLADVINALEILRADITAECEIVQTSEELSAQFPDHRLWDLQLYEHIND